MADKGVRRKLVAIMALDVVGFSRLMGEDEVGTLSVLKAVRSGIVEPAVTEHGGRIFKLMGDGALVEFHSVVDAVKSAVAIQQGMRSAPNGIELRVGVNLGDVIVEGRDLYGDGVNVAARLEGMAEPGGICISEKVYAEVSKKTDLAFNDMGEQQLKNIAAPIRTYQIDLGADASLVSSVDAILSRPAVAVLPFANMSGDPEQEYFSDGLTDDIITALSRWRSFPVIARNSTFTYKGQSVDVRKVASELGARYVLEGSVRKGGERVRITAQLIDASSSHHVWAEKFDRKIEDIFELQDEIAELIAAAVEPELRRAEEKLSSVKKRTSYQAWDFCQRGRSFLEERSKDGNLQARPLFERAIELDPTYCQAYAELAMTYNSEILNQYTDDWESSTAKLLEIARKAVQLDGSDSYAHTMLAYAYRWSRQHDLAVAEAETAVELNPSDAHAVGTLGVVLDFAGRSEEAIRMAEKAQRLNPRDSRIGAGLVVVARCHLNARHYDDAVLWARRAVNRPPVDARAYAILAISLAYLGRTEEAQSAFHECERYRPGFAGRWALLRQYRDPGDNEHIIEGLRMAGWQGEQETQH